MDKEKLWYYLTCWRPVTKKELLNQRKQFINVLNAMKENDLILRNDIHNIYVSINEITNYTKQKTNERKGKNGNNEMYG